MDAAALSNNNNASSDLIQVLNETKQSLDKSNDIQMRMELNLQKANEIQEKSALVQDKLMEFLQARLG